MKKHEILSPQSRAELFDPPTEPTAIVRHYTYSVEDLALIRERRRPANRLGFAVHLAYLRFPGRVIGVDETPPTDMLAFVAAQIGDDPKAFEEYAQRQQTRRAHLGELQAYLDVRAFRREDYRAVAHVAIEQATGSDRGDAIVSAIIEHLRQRRILLPAAVTLEKIALAARALARKRAHKSLADGLSPETIAKLEALLTVDDDQGRTPFAWLREWPEKPTQKNLSGIIERLQAVRQLGVAPDREKRIHRARYAAIAREIAILVPRDVSRFDTHRRLATLVVFAREMEAILTDAALAMFSKMLGSVFRRAENKHKENLVERAKALDTPTRALLGMAKAMLAAKDKGEDQVAAVERALGWERLKALVEEADKAVANARTDNLQELVERHATVRHVSSVLLGAFTFRSWKSGDTLLDALDMLRAIHANGPRKFPSLPPMAFLSPTWRKLVRADSGVDRRAYEVAVMMTLRDRLQAGDVWVEGSRAFRAFDDFLLPPDVFATRRRDGELGLAVGDRFEDWRDEKTKRLETRLREVDALAATGELPEATLTTEGLSISPIRKNENRRSRRYDAPALQHAAASAHHRGPCGGPWLDGLLRALSPSA